MAWTIKGTEGITVELLTELDEPHGGEANYFHFRDLNKLKEDLGLTDDDGFRFTMARVTSANFNDVWTGAIIGVKDKGAQGADTLFDGDGHIVIFSCPRITDTNGLMELTPLP